MNIVAAAIGSELHCVGLDDSGRICHRIRGGHGAWSPWGRLPESGFVSVSAVGVDAELHIVAITAEGIIWHNIRKEDESWQGWGQLPDQPLLGLFNEE